MARYLSRCLFQQTFRYGVETQTPSAAASLVSRGLASQTGSGGAPPELSDSIFVTNVSNLSGNSPILIGLMEYFQRHMPSVGFFMTVGVDPLMHTEYEVPKHVALLKKHFALPDSPRAMYGVSQPEAQALLAAGRTDELMEKVWNAYRDYKRGKELVIVEGSIVEGTGNPVELNGRFASELSSPVLMILDHHRDEQTTVQEMFNRCLIARASLESEHADVVGVVLNKVAAREHALVVAQLGRKLREVNLPFAGGIPADSVIGTARLNELAAGIGVRLLYGDPDDLDVDVGRMLACTSDVSHFLNKLEMLDKEQRREGLPPSRPLVVTTKDRADVVLSLAAAHSCPTGPNVAGIILCDAHLTETNPVVNSIISTCAGHMFPIMEVDMGPFEASYQTHTINPGILPDSEAKIKRAADLFARYVDANVVASHLTISKSSKLTPKSFLHKIHDLCRSEIQHIVLPEANDKRVLAAASEVVARGLARVTLLGTSDNVRAAARKYNIDISGCSILDYLNCSQIKQYVDAMVAARKAKGITHEKALDLLDDMNTFGTMMVAMGDADGMVSGATCTTANTIRPALQLLKTPQRTHVSSVFFMCLPDRVLTYGDCAVTVDPSVEELAQIAAVSADTATAFGITPRVAMLSYSTLGSGAGPAVDKVAAATALVKERRPDLLVEGPIQYDAAVDPAIAAQKMKGGSEVAGRATVCIFPDLNTGNNTYKAVQQSTGAMAIGPLIQGLRKPVNDLSRGCTVADIVNTVACTAVQAIGAKKMAVSGPGEDALVSAAAAAAGAAE